MDEGIRTSDADRDRIAARLRDHFAEGRLTREELDERLTATLNAKTFGDLGRAVADLPETAPAPLLTRQFPAPVRPGGMQRRGPRVFPVLMLALLAALVIPGAGWLLLAVLKIFLVSWLVVALAGVLIMAGFRRRMRRDWRHGYGSYRHQDWPGGFARQSCGHQR